MITPQVIEEATTSDIFYKDQIGDDHTTEIGDAESDGDDIAPSESMMPRTASKEYVYDPNKMTLKFIFANRDGVNVVLECKPSDTVGEVKAALLSLWPQGELLFISFNCLHDSELQYIKTNVQHFRKACQHALEETKLD
jgi:hypothetical protein